MNLSASFVRLFIAASAIAFLAGCASHGDSDQMTIAYHPKPGKGLVIVYREGTSLFREGWVGRIVNFRHINDDQRDLGKLSGGTFILDNATPGRHAFTAKDEDAKTIVNVEAGKTYFIRADLKAGMWTVGEALELVDFSEGASALKDLEESKPDE